MTVCIGAICDNGNTAIVASDRMVTSEYPPIEFEHTKRKIFPLTQYCLGLYAGFALKPVKIIPKIRAYLGKNPDIEEIVQKTKELYQFLRAEEAEELFLKPRTINKETFYTRGSGLFPADLFNMIDHEFVRHNYGLELLIVGVDKTGARIYWIRNPGLAECFDHLGFHATGVGYLHAIQVFVAHSYKLSYNVEEALNIVYAAKKAAEIAPGVGSETDISLIVRDDDQSKVVTVDPEIIAELSRIYDEVRKPPVVEIKEKSARLAELLDSRAEKSTDNKTNTTSDTKKDKNNDGEKPNTGKATD